MDWFNDVNKKKNTAEYGLSGLQMEVMLEKRKEDIDAEMIRTIHRKYFSKYKFVGGSFSDCYSIYLQIRENDIQYKIYIDFRYIFDKYDNIYNLVDYTLELYPIGSSHIYHFEKRTVRYQKENCMIVQYINDEIVEKRENMCEFIRKYHYKLYNTQFYNNLRRVTTFLLICKSQPIFPKDIYLLIAKKILFFCFLNSKNIFYHFT